MNPPHPLDRFSRAFPLGILFCQTIAVAAATTDSGIKYFSPDPQTGASAAVLVDDLPLIHTSQLLPLNERAEVMGPGDPAKQTEQLLAKLDQVLKAAGSGLRNAIKLNFYLAGAKSMPALLRPVQETLSREFSGPAKPAISFVVGGLEHRSILVAVDAVAA